MGHGDMKVLKLVGGIFLTIGLIKLGVAGYFYISQSDFIATAKSTQGQVIDMSRSSDDDGDTYAPVVRFTDDRGVTQEFVSRTSSNPPSYSRGEQVDLLYAPDNPGNAIIDDFFSRWGMVAILGGMGAIFSLVGGGMFFSQVRKAHIKKWLRSKGTAVSIDFYAVHRDTSLTVNGRNPFRVTAQGKNPFTGKLEQFISEAIWVDPTQELEGTKMRVYLDPNKPDRHSVDVERFLN